MTGIVWKDPPTIAAKLDRVRLQPGRWAKIDERKNRNAAYCKACELRKKHRGIEFRVHEGEIYARAKGNA
jgi:hypothetical protein